MSRILWDSLSSIGCTIGSVGLTILASLDEILCLVGKETKREATLFSSLVSY